MRPRDGVLAHLRGHDPGGIGLRRGIRAAIALPLALAVTMYVLDDTTAAAFAGFGAVGLLMTADYAGSALLRTVDYLVTGIVVSGLIVIGLAVSGNAALAAIGTFVIALMTSLAAMVRGSIATGAPAALLMYIVAACIGSSGTSVPDALAAWWVAVLVCTIVALIVLPRQRIDRARALLADVLDASARLAQAVWIERQDDAQIQELADSLDDLLSQLREVHAGKPFRPSGLTRRERILSLLIDHVWGLREVVRNPGLAEKPTEGTGAVADAARALAQATVSTQVAAANALRDRHTLPTVDAIVAARSAFREATVTETFAGASGGQSASQLAAEVQSRHLVGVASMVVEQTTQLVREVNNGDVQEFNGALNVPQRTLGTFIRSQASFDSPWLRNALRSAFGLAIAMVIVHLSNVQDGFWVLLGVVAVLRFDSFTTRRNAWQALLGTAIGVVLASLLILTMGQHLVLMWVLLPITVFLAGWAAVAWNYPIAQASFTGFVLILVAITKWPPKLLTGEFRFVDVAIGAGIAVAVALVMWPRGAPGALSTVMANTVRASWSYAAEVLRSYAVRTPASTMQADLMHARHAILAGSETYDITLMQRGPGANDSSGWRAITGDCFLLVNLGRTMAPYGQGPLPAGWSPSLTAVIDERIAVGDQTWSQIADRVAAGDADTGTTCTTRPTWSKLTDAPTDRDQALGFVVTIWFLDWIDRIDAIRPPVRP